MYQAHFGLSERPFSIAPDPRYLYMASDHREALAHLLYGICERGGFVQLTGEVGTGKTLITRKLIEDMPEDVDLALILNPALTVREFLLAICDELQIPAPARSHSTHALMERLTEYLLDAYARGRHTVVLIDEAHCLSTLVLEQIRLLTNLETTREKLLQIILVGQPELRDTLARQDMRQLAQRITARYHLRPLSLTGTRHYIRHRAEIANAPYPLFTRTAEILVHRLSGGVPRLLNVICDRSLLGAYAQRRARADAATVLRAAREVAGKPARRWRVAAAGVLASTMIAAGLAWRLTAPSAPAAAQVAVQAPAEHVAPKPADLSTWLSAAADTRSATALRTLFSLWGAPAAGEGACAQAVGIGLRCIYEESDWNQLARKNLPAVLELKDHTGRQHRVVARLLEGERMVLSTGGREQSFTRREIESLWAGSALMLWRPPAIGGELIVPGSRGAAVDWLVQQLNRIEGAGAASAGHAYDAALRERVRAFQRQHALEADGIVGHNTLVHLTTAVPDGVSPRLRGG